MLESALFRFSEFLDPQTGPPPSTRSTWQRGRENRKSWLWCALHDLGGGYDFVMLAVLEYARVAREARRYIQRGAARPFHPYFRLL